MKNAIKYIGLAVIAAIACSVITLVGCKNNTTNGDGGDGGGFSFNTLPGNVTISPSVSVTIGTPLTAAYSGGEAVGW